MSVTSKSDLQVSNVETYVEGTVPRGALLVHGDWGTGKTTFWRNQVAPRLTSLGKRPVYLSAAGLQSSGELDDALLLAVYPLLGNSAIKITSALLKAAVKHLKIEPSELKPTADFIAGLVVCVDDIERFLGSSQALFAFVQNIVETNSVHCVLIGNEKVLLEVGDSQKPLLGYAQIKEKVVARAFRFIPDVRAAISAYVAAIKDRNVRSALQSNEGVMNAAFETSAHVNLRTVAAVIDNCKALIEPALNVKDQDKLVKTIVSAATAALIYQRIEPDADATVLELIGNQEVSRYLAWSDKQETEKGQTLKKFVGMFAPLEPMSWPSLPAVARFLSTGLLDRDALRTEYERIATPVAGDQFNALFSNGFRSFTSASFTAAIDAYYEHINGSDPETLEFVAAGASAMFFFSSQRLVTDDLAGIERIHKEVLDRREAAKTLVVPGDIGSLDHILDALSRNGGDAGRSVGEHIVRMFERARAEIRNDQRSQLFEKLFESAETFASEAFDEKNGFRFDPIFAGMDGKYLGARIRSLGSAALLKLRYYLQWRHIHPGAESRDELPVFDDVIQELSDVGRDESATLSIEHWNLRQLRAELEKIKSEIQNAAPIQ